MTNSDDRPKPESFGFGNDMLDLSKVKPKPLSPPATVELSKPKIVKPKTAKPKPSKPKQAASDKIAKSMGFSSREAAQPVLLKKRRRTNHDEPVDQLSIRGPVRILNDFITHCEDQGVSYWEGLETLLDLAKRPNSKK